MRIVWVGILCWLAMGTAWGGNKHAVERSIEATMKVTGSMDVDDKGTVTSHAIDHPEKLPQGVVQLLDQTLHTFRFEPVLRNGRPRAVRAKMTLVVAANHVDPDHIAVRVRSALFLESDPPPGEMISIKQRGVMRYPVEAEAGGVTGTVYVALRIDRTGHVVDAQAEQVNLRVVDDESRMQRWRDVLAKPTLVALRNYTFNVPTSGKHANDEYFTGTIAVVYSLESGSPPPGYGKWDSYVPGPRQEIPWLDEQTAGARNNNDAIPDGTFAQAGTDLKLLTPLGG
jgi:hypothetical protein